MSDPGNDYLYHYTSAEGLIGIVKTREIWATNILYLNDVREFRHGVELGEKYVKRLLEKADDPDEREYLKKLAAGVEERKTTWEAPGFVCSFTESGDDLSQWRAYCPTGGFAIGFPKHLLAEIASDYVYMFEKCSYDPTSQERAISGYIDEGIQRDVAACRGYRKCRWATMRLTFAAATLKDPAFESEREWRMVRYPGPEAEKEGMNFRTNHGVVVPYMTCHLEFTKEEKEARTRKMWRSVRVTVGPSPDPKASKASVEKLLSLWSPAKSPGEVTVTSVPYKFW